MTYEPEIPGVSHMRVVLMSDVFAGKYGTGTYYPDLAENLEAHIDHIELLCPKGDNSEIEEKTLFPVPGDPTQNVVLPNLRQIGAKIRSLRPHIIIIATPGPYGFIGLVQARRLGIPLFVVFQTEFDELIKIYWNRVLYRASKIYLDGVYKLFFRLGIGVIVPSSDLKSKMHKLGARNVTVMGTLIAKNFISAPVMPLGKEINTILYLGRLSQEKNVDDIMKSAHDFPDLHFLMAGDGRLKRKVIERANVLDNLEFLGWVSRDTVISLIDRSDMLLLPSKVEAFGTVALEAMARRRLVLVSPNCGIIRDPLLRKGLFQMEPQEALTAAIHRIRRLDYDTRNEKADMARKSAEAYNRQTVAQWVNLFRQQL